MKTAINRRSIWTALPVLGAMLIPWVAQAGSTAPTGPVGTLTANTFLVRLGVSPILTWNITYPQPITEIVTKNEDDTITPKKRVRMDVRLIGADYRYDATRFKPVRLEASVNGGSYVLLFQGTHPSINPANIIYSTTVPANQVIRFRFRGSTDTGTTNWNPYRYGPDYMVAAMINGDSPPVYAPYLSKNSVVSYLTPYLDDDDKILLGPRDVIWCVELTNTDTDASGFDMQDLVMIATFTEV